MKKLLAVLGIAASLSVPGLALAQETWKLDKLRADIVIGADGVVDVTETVDADFTTARHGIYRYIPTRGKDTDGKSYALSVSLLGVTRDGNPERADSSRSGDNLVWRVGDPNVTMTGTHEYVLKYSVTGAIGRFADFDELYWNVSGEGWDAPLPNVSATVTLPEGVLPTQSACYTGPYGSNESDCDVISSGGQVGFVSKNAGEAMTIAVGFPKGVVAMPSLARRLWDFFRAHGIWMLPILVLIFCYWRWLKNGRDASLGTLVVQYDAPSGLTPAETSALLAENASARSLAPTIVDLAARGYIKIEETDKKGLIGTSKTYALSKTKEWSAAADLRPFESKLLNDLFAASPDRVEISSLKNTFYPRVQEFTAGVMKSITERGYFTADPVKVRLLWIGVGSVIAIVGWGIQAAAVVACGLIVAVFGYFMPKRSPEGAAAAAHARGFKEFISSVEKYRAPWMEDQNIFFRTLPYALAFGLGRKWAQAFAGLNMQPPNWYVGADMATWSALSFNDDLASWSKSFTATASSRPSSGSGSGGGGFSGGGFGGGGGGSW